MAKSVTLFLKKQHPTDKFGMMYIRTIEDRISKKKSLRIKLKESDYNKYFNPELQRFKNDQRFKESKEFNLVIANKLKELSQIDNEITYLPKEKKSFIKFWEKYIETFNNHGTKIKHQVVLIKLRKYLNSKNKEGLLFIEITPLFLRNLKYHFLTIKDPKILSNNTVNHYLKIIKSVINRAQQDDYFNYNKNPFDALKFKKEAIIKEIISSDELKSLLRKKVTSEKLLLTKNMFVFQLFASGMRVSDLMFLRWNNFDYGRLKYKMFKTSVPISIPVTISMADILYDLTDRSNRYTDMFNLLTETIIMESGKIEELTLNQINEKLKPIAYLTSSLDFSKSESAKLLIKQNSMEEYKGYCYTINNRKMVRQLLDSYEILKERTDKAYINTICAHIRSHKKSNLNDFVFPILKNEDFENIDSKNEFKKKISIGQYKLLKNATIVYNRQLKLLQQSCKIKTTLSSHVARHSYTNLLLRMKDVNLYDISQSLGHTNLTITQNYISTGFNIEKTDYLNDTLSKNFRRG